MSHPGSLLLSDIIAIKSRFTHVIKHIFFPTYPKNIKSSINCSKKQNRTHIAYKSGAGKQHVDPKKEKQTINMSIETLAV